MVVLTADHGSVAGKHFFGKRRRDQGLRLQQLVLRRRRERRVPTTCPQDALLPLVDTGNVGLSYSDSMLRVCSTTSPRPRWPRRWRRTGACPTVTAVWRRDGDHYTRVTPVRWELMKSSGERRWFRHHAQELVDTEAAVYGPDVIATLPDDTTYSVAGDHGGIQRASQQIPIVFAGGALSECRTSRRGPLGRHPADHPPRHGDHPTHPMDGIAYTLPTKK